MVFILANITGLVTLYPKNITNQVGRGIIYDGDGNPINVTKLNDTVKIIIFQSLNKNNFWQTCLLTRKFLPH